MSRFGVQIGDERVTRDVTDLAWKNAALGGHIGCEFRLARPPRRLDAAPEPYVPAVVWGPDGSPAFDGLMTNPGPGSGLWTPKIAGPIVTATDIERPRFYALTLFDGFTDDSPGMLPAGEARIGVDPGGIPSLALRFPRGTVVAANAVVGMVEQTLNRIKQPIARIDLQWQGMGTATDYRVQLLVRGPGTVQTVRSDTFSAASPSAGFSARSVGTNWTHPKYAAEVRLAKATLAETVGNDTTGVWVRGFSMTAVRKNAAGAEILTGYTSTVSWSEVITDLLGDRLPLLDGTVADSGSLFRLDNLGYRDSSFTALQGLDDSLLFHPGHTYAAYGRDGGDTYRFDWGPIPEEPRYDLTSHDGYEPAAPDPDLWGAVEVRWTAADGTPLFHSATQPVPLLDAQGRDRVKGIDLSADLGSAANAAWIAEQFLAEHRDPPVGGRMRITRRVYDRWTGRMVEPWQMRPGCWVNLPDIPSRPSTTRPVGTLGSRAKLSTVTYEWAHEAAVVEFDTPVRDLQRIIGDAVRAAQRRRR